MINSLVTMDEESGHYYLERWKSLNAYSGCMIGNPAISVITDAYAKGKTFVIEPRNNSAKNIYIQSAKLNGKAWNKCWLTYEQISCGGILELEMGDQPDKSWGIE
jgi:putative alpha-1,2-mannosidase